MHDIETPSPWMVRHAVYAKPQSELLDVACGAVAVTPAFRGAQT